jgi:hypothetical protein
MIVSEWRSEIHKETRANGFIEKPNLTGSPGFFRAIKCVRLGEGGTQPYAPEIITGFRFND